MVSVVSCEEHDPASCCYSSRERLLLLHGKDARYELYEAKESSTTSNATSYV